MRNSIDCNMNKRMGGMVAGAVLALGCGAEGPAPAPANRETDSSVEADAAQVRDWLPSGYVETPNGQVHESCIHEVPEGGEVDRDGAIRVNGQMMRAPSPCGFEVLHLNRANVVNRTYGDVARQSSPLLIDGWTRYVQATANNMGVFPVRFNGLETTMIVPSPPSQQLFQTIFLFPSFTPADAGTILQPVLRWGDGIQKWLVAAWYGDRLDNYYHSQWVQVTPGENIVGSVRDVRNSCVGTDCMWDVKLSRGGTTLTLLRIASSEAYTRVQKAALEVYGVTSCKHLPASGVAAFINTKVYEPYDPSNVDARIEVTNSLAWRKVTVNSSCGIDALFPNPQTSQIVWNPN
jgi:hypothetical protein